MAGADGQPWACRSAWLLAFLSAVSIRMVPTLAFPGNAEAIRTGCWFRPLHARHAGVLR